MLKRYYSPDFIMKQEFYFEERDIYFWLDSLKVYIKTTLYFKGVVCKLCNRKASFFYLEKTNELTNRWIIKPYVIDEFGEKYELTKDHIHPKSKGGKNHLHNYQVLCQKCNLKKADKYV